MESIRASERVINDFFHEVTMHTGGLSLIDGIGKNLFYPGETSSISDVIS